MAPKVVDITEIILKWAKKYPLERDQRAFVNLKDLSEDNINWDHLRVSHDSPVYDDERKLVMPNSHILLTAVYSNNTENRQSYNFHAERKTKSVCSISITEGFSAKSSFNIQLTPPNPIVQANAGLSMDYTLSEGATVTKEHELTWSVDTTVLVPSMKTTTASLVIKEADYNGDFTIKSHFRGRIHVILRDKNNCVVTVLHSKIKDLIKDEEGFIKEGNNYYFLTRGHCSCRYGSEQQVLLDEDDYLPDKMKKLTLTNEK